jgi:hypothetical protein
MQTTLKEISGINCEIQTEDGFTDIQIALGNARLATEWIVRKAPEAIAEQIGSIVIQHLLLAPKPPEKVWEPVTTASSTSSTTRGIVEVGSATPEGEAWILNEKREVSHNYAEETEHGIISFYIGKRIAFQLAYQSTR